MKKILTSILFLSIWLCAMCDVVHVPYDCHAPCEAIRVPELPASHPIPVPWVAAATVIPGIANDGYVEVDWMQLIDLDQGGMVVLESHFDVDGMLSSELGGLFGRWFPPGSARTPLTNSMVQNGILRVNVGAKPDNVNHWWLAGYKGIPGHRYALKMRFRMHGHIGVQLGCDFWTVPSEDGSATLMEGWCSDWYGDTGGEFIEVTSPLPEEERIKFNRRHYGFSSEGIFYITRELMNYIGSTSAYLMYDGEEYPMTLKGDKYIADTDQWVSYMGSYYFRTTNPVQERKLPDTIYDPERGVDHLTYPGDVRVDNNTGTYYFHSRWQDVIFYDELNQAECSIWLDANNTCHIKAIRFGGRIKRAQFYDIKGRRLFSYDVPAADGQVEVSIPLPKLAVQALLVKVTASNGQSLVKKLAILPK